MGETQLLINITLYSTVPGGAGRNGEIAHSLKKRKNGLTEFPGPRPKQSAV